MGIIVFFIDFNEVIYTVYLMKYLAQWRHSINDGFVLYLLKQIREEQNLFLSIDQFKAIQFTKIYQTLIA